MRQKCVFCGEIVEISLDEELDGLLQLESDAAGKELADDEATGWVCGPCYERYERMVKSKQ